MKPLVRRKRADKDVEGANQIGLWRVLHGSRESLGGFRTKLKGKAAEKDEDMRYDPQITHN